MSSSASHFAPAPASDSWDIDRNGLLHLVVLPPAGSADLTYYGRLTVSYASPEPDAQTRFNIILRRASTRHAFEGRFPIGETTLLPGMLVGASVVTANTEDNLWKFNRPLTSCLV